VPPSLLARADEGMMDQRCRAWARCRPQQLRQPPDMLQIRRKKYAYHRRRTWDRFHDHDSATGRCSRCETGSIFRLRAGTISCAGSSPRDTPLRVFVGLGSLQWVARAVRLGTVKHGSVSGPKLLRLPVAKNAARERAKLRQERKFYVPASESNNVATPEPIEPI
jgi:hypothetical protein